MQVGSYTLGLTVTDWLGSVGTTSWTFTKQRAPVPLVSVVGGINQTFFIADGVRLATVVDKTTVCNGKLQVRCYTSTVAGRSASSDLRKC